ncbi:TPA: hypothetical protein KRE09_002342 [Clostridioides difficile]|uniref:hypothetical protein n=1 Tax=Clostridioides difficile TaxID=1496 RepID=UPI00038CA4F1|nr:hypothetical protein [Clostridioides difficile]AUO78383.1 hypothetical protein LIBA6276_00165 [Clostridioides phage LIBA6276]EQG38272.1 hypothetical protein QIO_0472 [Clostridioides difficile DA00129]MBG0082258.1 hypothetical protein [Clostridioides difficile]MBH7476112.1 hypothetical protein [Clostridioides difficile]MBY1346385.1 hypothetical protein [Clostridioides difficile]
MVNKNIKILREDYSEFLDDWNIIGKRNIYKCPECQYHGNKCDRHNNDEGVAYGFSKWQFQRENR